MSQIFSMYNKKRVGSIIKCESEIGVLLDRAANLEDKHYFVFDDEYKQNRVLKICVDGILVGRMQLREDKSFEVGGIKIYKNTPILYNISMVLEAFDKILFSHVRFVKQVTALWEVNERGIEFTNGSTITVNRDKQNPFKKFANFPVLQGDPTLESIGIRTDLYFDFIDGEGFKFGNDTNNMFFVPCYYDPNLESNPIIDIIYGGDIVTSGKCAPLKGGL